MKSLSSRSMRSPLRVLGRAALLTLLAAPGCGGEGPTSPRGVVGRYVLREYDGHPVGTRYTNGAGYQVTVTGGSLTVGADSTTTLRVTVIQHTSEITPPPGSPAPGEITYETRGPITAAGTSTDGEGTWEAYLYTWPVTNSAGQTSTAEGPLYVRGDDAKFFTYRFRR